MNPHFNFIEQRGCPELVHIRQYFLNLFHIKLLLGKVPLRDEKSQNLAQTLPHLRRPCDRVYVYSCMSSPYIFIMSHFVTITATL